MTDQELIVLGERLIARFESAAEAAVLRKWPDARSRPDFEHLAAEACCEMLEFLIDFAGRNTP